MNVLILASAPETEYGYVRELAQQADYIICADGGTRHAAACGIRPDLVVGDFDSGKRPDTDTETITLKPEKDDSDLMCCTREALRRGADVIAYACASGGRIDHFLSNLSLLEYLYEQGSCGRFCDKCKSGITKEFKAVLQSGTNHDSKANRTNTGKDGGAKMRFL